MEIVIKRSTAIIIGSLIFLFGIGCLAFLVSHNLEINKTIENIHNNYTDMNISLKTMSAQLGANPAYLGRQFKVETNEFFNDYLNRIRIDAAQELLKTTDKKINEVAMMVGYTSATYFCKMFKKLVGLNPGDVR